MIGIRVILHEWFLGIITDCMQFVDRIVLEWFLFIDSRSIEWIWIECAKIAYHGDWLLQDRKRRKEGHSVL